MPSTLFPIIFVTNVTSGIRVDGGMMATELNLHESAENYLEAILVITNKSGHVRSIDLAEHFGYSKPSISRATSLLVEGGLITKADDGCLLLTDEGLRIANQILDRHQTLTQWLTSLGVAPGTAADDACRIEHVISEETFDRIKDALG